MNVVKPLPSSSKAVRSPRANLVYVKELEALVQEDLLSNVSRVATKGEKTNETKSLRYYRDREPYWEPLVFGTFWCSECHADAEEDQVTGEPILADKCPYCGVDLKIKTLDVDFEKE